MLGNASLYHFEDAEMSRFFYSKEESAPVQLVFKTYVKEGNKLTQNKSYLQQLINDLSCEGHTESQVKMTSYNRKSLMKYFRLYNECTGNEFTGFEIERAGFAYNISIRPGVNYASFAIIKINFG